MLAAIDRVAGGGESAGTKGDSLGMPGGVVFLTMTRTLKCQLHSQFPLSLQSGPNFRTAVKSCSRRSLNTYHWYEMSGQVLVVNSCTDGKYFGSRYFTFTGGYPTILPFFGGNPTIPPFIGGKLTTRPLIGGNLTIKPFIGGNGQKEH
uniref:Uncharacterized protein n=1 Tax=Spongospora subterranea TaxID=70186 RepID=A0A0H5R1A0_9EUKA|eukprot:CRZ08003.1 hypothetical protein [Spongospora subterranea]